MSDGPEIVTDESGVSEESRETMRRCDLVNHAILKLTGTDGHPNDMAMWANALTIVAGSMFGMIHEQLGVSEKFDEASGDAIRFNFLHGVKIGRAEAVMGGATRQ